MTPPPSPVLSAFLRLSRGRDEGTVALRALTLHMLSGLAPGFFERHRLARTFAGALTELQSIPATLDATVEPDVAMARLDALYVRSLRGDDAVPVPSTRTLTRLFAAVDAQSPLYAWLLAQLAAKLGRKTRFADRSMAECCATPVEELYFATHELLLEGDYCRRRLDPRKFAPQRRLLRSRTRDVIEQGQLDVGAEIAFCLSMLGDREHAAPLLKWLRAHQRPDGVITEPGSAAFDQLHTTAAGLLALAAADEPHVASPGARVSRSRV